MKFRIISSTFAPQVINKITKAFPDDEKPIVLNPQDDETIISGTIMAIALSTQIDNTINVIETIRNEYDSLFYLISDAIDCREGIPPGGSRRMVKIAQAIGRILQLNDNQQWILEHSCVLRDIGKLRISNDILLKKTVLDYDEWILLKSHAHLGANLLREWNIFPEITEVIASHHECYDGDGYPEGLEGEQIPYLSRILKVLDVYCAMTSRRAYRSGVATREEAIEYLLEERGKHFDPEIIDAFMHIDLQNVDNNI